MMVLGLDPSLRNFGWAIYDTEAAGLNHCVGRGRFETSSKDLFVGRYIALRNKLIGLIQSKPIDRVGIEYPIFNDFYSEGMYALFMFCCEALLEVRKDVVFLANTQTKARALRVLRRPKGIKATKKIMMAAAKRDTGLSGWSGDTADAYWASYVAARWWLFHDGLVTELELDDLERHQFTRTHTFKRGKRAGETIKKGIIYRQDERFFLWSEMKGIPDAKEKS